MLATATVNNPELDLERDGSHGDDDDEGMMEQMFRMESVDPTSLNPEGQGRQRGLNMDLRPNFSQVIAEAVQDIITRYNSEDGQSQTGLK